MSYAYGPIGCVSISADAIVATIALAIIAGFLFWGLARTGR